MRIAAGALVTIAVLALGGCNKPQADSVDDTALEAINEAVAAELNAAPQAITQLIKSLDKPTPIGLDSLQISLDQKAVPVDWWMLQHGVVQMILPPPTPGRSTFLVTPGGSQMAAQAPVWFSAAAGAPSRVDCHSSNVQAAGGCEVEVAVVAQATESGAGMMAPGATLDPIKVQAIVAQGADGWEVRELHAEGAGLHDLALNALLGKEAQRNAARQQVLANLSLGQATPVPEGAIPMGAADLQSATPPPPDLAPVTPVVGESPYAPRRPPGAR